MKETGAITGISVAYSRATVDEIEAAGGDGVRATVSDLLARDGVEEAFAIQTCNRSEAYVVTDRTIDGSVALESFAPEVRGGAVRRLDHEESLEHLMRVASGLESLVLGEDQIIGQLREAYEESKSAGGIGPVLKDGVTKALHVGERARNETSINEGSSRSDRPRYGWPPTRSTSPTALLSWSAPERWGRSRHGRSTTPRSRRSSWQTERCRTRRSSPRRLRLLLRRCRSPTSQP